jgi:REP element-mobilizing transposase RayT
MVVIKLVRGARKKSETGIYHIMLRGANKQEIFHDEEDRFRFIGTIKKCKKEVEFLVYGWCLMDNHVHLLIEEGIEDISITMKRIGVSYVWYYNQKYKTTGHLFQDRFRSEAVETDDYLLGVLRYIHQNPVKAGYVKKSDEWKWSSYSEYVNNTTLYELTDCIYILDMFADFRNTAIKRFKEFTQEINDDKYLDQDNNEKIHLDDEEARQEIFSLLDRLDVGPGQVKAMSKTQRDEILREVKNIKGVTQRQAARILGVSPNLVFKA